MQGTLGVQSRDSGCVVLALLAAAAGSVAFRLLVATALRAGLDPDWLKAATAVVVVLAGL